MTPRLPFVIVALLLAACARHSGHGAGSARAALVQDAEAGALVGETLAGERVELRGPGPVRLVELWATWCGPCGPAAELARPVLRRHPGVVAWSLALDEPAAVASHVASHPVLGSVLVYPGGLVAATRRGLNQVPTFLAIDRHGRVTGAVVGFRPGLAAALDHLLERAERLD